MEKRVWTKEEVRNLILSSDAMVERSLSKLAARQTSDEFFAEDTKYHNGVGFNANDAPILTSFAKSLSFRSHLTLKQLFVARKKLLKYSGQLTSIANKINPMVFQVLVCIQCAHAKSLHHTKTGCIVPFGWKHIGQGATRPILLLCGCVAKGRKNWQLWDEYLDSTKEKHVF